MTTGTLGTLGTPLRELYHRDEHMIDLDNARMECEDELMRDATDEELAAWLAEHHWLPVTTCGLCDRDLPEDNTLGICNRCAGVAQAHARLEAAHAEWVSEGRLD